MTTTEIEALPKCDNCGATLVLRESAHMTYEQKFCGVWYDHPMVNQSECMRQTSVLYPSRELRQQWADLGSVLA